MSKPDAPKHTGIGEPLRLEPIPKEQQVRNFATVYGETIPKSFRSSTTYYDRLNLIKAFKEFDQSYFLKKQTYCPTVNFTAMSAIGEGSNPTHGFLCFAPAYPSQIQDPLVGYVDEYSKTQWGGLVSLPENPYYIMRIWRGKELGNRILGQNTSNGLYAALSKDTEELHYFAVTTSKKSGELFVVYPLDESLEIVLANEMEAAAKVVLINKKI